MMHVRADGRVSPNWHLILVWLYVDDVLFQCPAQHVDVLMTVVMAALSRFKLSLQRRKCAIHVPALAGTALNDWPPEAKALADVLPLAPEGLIVLGTDAAGDHALPLGPFAAAAEKTRERAAQACRLAKAALQLVYRPPPAGGKQIAWRICRNVITHALDYDSRILTSSLVLPHAAVVEQSAWEIVQAVIGRELSEDQRAQVQLPTCLAGCQMPMPTLIVPLARAAGVLETGLAVRNSVEKWGYDLATARRVDGVDDAVADGIFEGLHGHKVMLSAPGRPARWSGDGTASQTPDMLRPAVPPRHVLSNFLRVHAEASYEDVLSRSTRRDRTRLRSAGGPNAGKALVAPAGLQATHYTDEQVVEVLRWRLGLAEIGEIPRCRNLAAKTMEECGEARDGFGDHAASCSFGPLRIKRHDNIAESLADIIEETGAHVRREAYVKAFSTPQSEAWLDIWAFAGLHIEDLLVDVTVRHPMASAYQPSASSRDGAAASVAEEKKLLRYPARGGRSVVPFAMETWGRLGPSAEELMQTLASEATRHARRRGNDATAGAFLRRWRATLDAVLQKSMAKALMSARVGLPGRPHQRQWGS
jgi:hypothetical protein